MAAALICAAPALAVLWLAFAGGGHGFGGERLFEAALTSFGLALIGGGGAVALGTGAALLVTLCRFPGRGVFAWLLAAPLAAPSFVLAYAYSSLTWAGGPIPLPLTGFWGAAFVYAFGLYPYAYLAVRSGLATQSADACEAARTLGAGPRTLLLRIVLPLARPALAAGAALTAMEIVADYGAAQHFGLTTLATAIFRVWYAEGSTHAAMQIAALLLAASLLFLLLEQRTRGRASFASENWRAFPGFALSRGAALAACSFCTLLVGLGAGLPLAWLARLALTHANVEDLAGPLFNTLTLAGAGALATLALSAIVAASGRRARLATLAASAGYAAPGAVIALGAMALFSLARGAGWVGGLSGGLALIALIWTYAARFAAVGAQPIAAGLARAPKNIDAAAATLGAGGWRRLLSIDLPIAGPSLAAAALLLFVEIVKELPATLILRPFDFDTLAVRAYAYASDERLLEAAAPSLMIFATGLAPMLLLSRRIGGAR
jgi:iron(III) transport system permease protein